MEAYCFLFLSCLMVGCFVRSPVDARVYKEGITRDKGLTIIRSKGPHQKGKPASAFTHVDANDKYTKNRKHGPVEHVFDGSDKHDDRLRDARTRLRDYDKYKGFEPVQPEPLEDFHDLRDNRNTRTRLMNDGKTIVFTGDEERHAVEDVMHPENREAERRKPRIHEGKSVVFSDDDKVDKGFNQDPRKSPETRPMVDVNSYNMQLGKQQAPAEPNDDHSLDDSKLSRKKRSDDEEPSLQRVKRLVDEEPSLQRMKRLDGDESTQQRVKLLSDDLPPSQHEKLSDDETISLDRVKRLDEDELSNTEAKRLQGKPKMFEGLPIEPQITRLGDDREALSRMKRMQDEKLSKYDKELSRMKRHHDDEPPVKRYKSDDDSAGASPPDD